MKIQIRYLTTRPGKHGTTRHFWQPSAELQAAGWTMQTLGTDATIAAGKAEQHNKDVDAWRSGLAEQPVTAEQGSIEALIRLYKKSRFWRELAPKTQDGYEYCFRIIRAWAADSPVTAITPKLVQLFYESMMEQYPAKAAFVIRVLRLLMQYAIRENMILINPASKPGIKSHTKKGTRWEPAQVLLFAAQADALGMFSIGTAVVLNEWIGQRKGDLITMPPTAYRDGVIYIRQNKTGAEVELPVDDVPELKARLDLQLEYNRALPVTPMVVLPQPSGLPYSEYWFTHQVATVRNAIPGMEKLIFKDLRHTAVTRLAEAGCEIPVIASITGHSFGACNEIVDRYNIRTARMAKEGFRLRRAAASST